MTIGAWRPDRRTVLRGGLVMSACFGAAPILARRVIAAGRPRAYVASGAGALSLLDDPDYRRVFESIFSGLDARFAAAPSSEALLEGMMAADLVYLSVHSNSQVIGTDQGRLVSIGDIVRRRRTVGRGPRLVVIAGCLTLDNQTRTTLPRAFGVEEGASGAAYIGFSTTIVGKNVDAFFRIFFSLWLKPAKDGTHRTLEAARSEAIDFIEARIVDNAAIKAQGNTDAGKMMGFAAGVPNVGRKMVIVGDSGLRLTDLDRPFTVAPSDGGAAGTTAGSSSSPTPSTSGAPSPSTSGGVPTNAGSSGASGGGGSWTPSGGSSWSPGGGGRAPGSSGSSGAPGPVGGGDADAINDMLKR